MAIAPGMKEITQDIASSHDARIAEVGRLKTEAKEMLSGFGASHMEMGTQLRRDLAQEKAKVKSKVKTMRKGFRTSHKETASALRNGLAKHTQEIKGEVAKARQEIKGDLKEAKTAWQELASTMRTKRGIVATQPKPKVEMSVARSRKRKK